VHVLPLLEPRHVEGVEQDHEALVRDLLDEERDVCLFECLDDLDESPDVCLAADERTFLDSRRSPGLGQERLGVALNEVDETFVPFGEESLVVGRSRFHSLRRDQLREMLLEGILGGP
jgi:hypothetical protein